MTHRTSVTIAAPAELVWATTVDIAGWPTWTPTVTKGERLEEGPFRLGATARLAQPGLPDMVWTVTELTDGTSFRWEARRAGVAMAARHDIAPQGDGSVVVTLTLEVGGPLGKVVDLVGGRKIDTALAQEAAGLKAFCERTAG